ncbi:C-C motif chemokine 14-like isoform X3 [Cervus elaphus]|uniref:C-C motif chemokine 14-like isoform X3 n=1 Tax=Cervus elaphus TaxID=9860 RepID=UPI001CC2B872|nr:C-C motif chemokine 14-like isoform X3 [Cervus elaphus]
MVSTAAVSFLLLLSTTVALGSENESSSRLYHPTECCFTYTRRAIPRQLISSYYETSSLCSKPGIIFVTRKGLYVCANPHDGWVWDYIKELEE